ncbi:hypothetical protein PFISCL1PPCAC_26650, partial [Pristionchus fissidentatus]
DRYLPFSFTMELGEYIPIEEVWRKYEKYKFDSIPLSITFQNVKNLQLEVEDVQCLEDVTYPAKVRHVVEELLQKYGKVGYAGVGARKRLFICYLHPFSLERFIGEETEVKVKRFLESYGDQLEVNLAFSSGDIRGVWIANLPTMSNDAEKENVSNYLSGLFEDYETNPNEYVEYSVHIDQERREAL